MVTSVFGLTLMLPREVPGVGAGTPARGSARTGLRSLTSVSIAPPPLTLAPPVTLRDSAWMPAVPATQAAEPALELTWIGPPRTTRLAEPLISIEQSLLGWRTTTAGFPLP